MAAKMTKKAVVNKQISHSHIKVKTEVNHLRKWKKAVTKTPHRIPKFAPPTVNKLNMVNHKIQPSQPLYKLKNNSQPLTLQPPLMAEMKLLNSPLITHVLVHKRHVPKVSQDSQLRPNRQAKIQKFSTIPSHQKPFELVTVSRDLQALAAAPSAAVTRPRCSSPPLPSHRCHCSSVVTAAPTRPSRI
ncbi:hypothetical protein WN943_024448 [Citrus x changshan-huyou]